MGQFYMFFTPVFGILIGLFMIIAGAVQTSRMKKRNNSAPNMVQKDGVNYVGGNIASIVGGVMILLLAVGMLGFRTIGTVIHGIPTSLSFDQRLIQIIEITLYGVLIIGLIIPILSLAIKKKNHTVPVKVRLDHYETNVVAKTVDTGPNAVMAANNNRAVFVLDEDEFKHEFKLNVDPHKFHEGGVYDAFLEYKNTYDSIYLVGNHWGLILVYSLEWFFYIILMIIFTMIKTAN